MREGWEITKLGDACLIRPPKREAKAKLAITQDVSFSPMESLGIRQKNYKPRQTRQLGKVYGGYTYFAEGDVLLAKITPCFQNGKLGIAQKLTNGIGFGSSEFFVFRCQECLSPEFLFYFLSQESVTAAGVSRMSGAVGHQRVPLEFIEHLPVPIPALPEQERIVAILDEAFKAISTATKNAEQNLVNAQELFEAGFRSIFDSASQRDWETARIEQIANSNKGSIRTGPFGSQLLHREFVKEGIAVLGIDNAVKNTFAWDQRRFITPDKFKKLSRFEAFPNDVIITIMGTCGRCAILPKDLPRSITSKHLCCITLDTRKCLPGSTSPHI